MARLGQARRGKGAMHNKGTNMTKTNEAKLFSGGVHTGRRSIDCSKPFRCSRPER